MGKSISGSRGQSREGNFQEGRKIPDADGVLVSGAHTCQNSSNCTKSVCFVLYINYVLLKLIKIYYVKLYIDFPCVLKYTGKRQRKYV